MPVFAKEFPCHKRNAIKVSLLAFRSTSFILHTMSYIAMNRFRIVKGQESEFEEIWKTRNTYLESEPGFVAFHLLKGPEREDHILYASHTLWESEDHFTAWTKSEAFRKAHAGAGNRGHLYLGHPEFEGFETVDGAAVSAKA